MPAFCLVLRSSCNRNSLMAAWFALAAAPVWHAAAMADEAASIEVQVKGVRNAQGRLGCALFASPTGFARETDKAKVAAFAPIATSSGICEFRNLPAGTYAVSVMHDENSNQKLDSNFLGAPTEGYGVSNNKTYAMSPPKWDESRFELAAGEKKTVSITLRY